MTRPGKFGEALPATADWRQIRRGIDTDDTLRPLHLSPNSSDFGLGMGRAQERHVQHLANVHVIEITTAPFDEDLRVGPRSRAANGTMHDHVLARSVQASIASTMAS